MAKIILANEGSTPATPPSGSVVLYPRGGVMYTLDSSGNTTPTGSEGVFTAGPTGSGATYTGATAIADAVAAAVALIPGTITSAVVQVLPGSYTENITLPANVSLMSMGVGSYILLTGLLTLTGATGFQTVSGVQLTGNVVLNAGGASTAMVLLDHLLVDGDGITVAFRVLNSGWQIQATNCTLDGNGLGALSLVAGAGIEATSSNFRGAVPAIDSAGTVDLTNCYLEDGINLTGASLGRLVNTTVVMTSGAALVAFTVAVGCTLEVKGTFSVSGIDAAAGTLWSGAGTLTVQSGVFLGTYNSGFLPTVTAQCSGALAFLNDTNVMNLVNSSGNWASTLAGTLTANGDLLVRAAGVLAALPDVAVGQVLKSGGVGVLPAYGAIGGTTAADGTGATGTGTAHNHAFTGTALTFSGHETIVNPAAPDLVSIVAALDPPVDGAMVIAAQPADACKLQIRIVDGDNSLTGNVVLVGVGARGQALTQTEPLAGGTRTILTDDAYVTVTSVTLDTVAGAAAGDSVGVGQSSHLGLPGAQTATNFVVYRAEVGANANSLAQEAVGTVDATAGTIDPTTPPNGTLDYAFYYTFNVTPVGSNAAESTHTHTGPSHTHSGTGLV